MEILIFFIQISDWGGERGRREGEERRRVGGGEKEEGEGEDPRSPEIKTLRKSGLVPQPWHNTIDWPSGIVFSCSTID